MNAKNTTPYISVVMSVYNAERYLTQAIESILNQSFTNFEFIIIEDCSTDNSLAIIKEFAEKDARIRLIQKAENRRMAGFIENLNIGLNEAKGKYIARMDADDISYPNRFEKQVKFLDENPDIFMVGSSVNFIDEEDKFIKKHSAIELHEKIAEMMPKNIAMYHPVLMFRNDSEVRYREKMLYCEDYDLYLRLILEGKRFYNFTEVLLNYRILGNSISRKDNIFIRRLFQEKMKSFYLEKLRKGKDTYEHFCPEACLEILDKDKKTPKEYMKFALNIATKHNYKDIFKQLLKKNKKYYTNDLEIFILKILNYLPSIFTKIYFKTQKRILR